MSHPPLGFTFRRRKMGGVQGLRRGVVAGTLRGAGLEDFLAAVAARLPEEARRLMARITGDFRRGNERLASEHRRNRRQGTSRWTRR